MIKRVHGGVLLLLVVMALYVAGSTFGRPRAEYAPSIEQRAWLNPGHVFHPDEFAYVGKTFRMLLRRDWNPRYYHNPSLNIYSNYALFWAGDSASYPHDLSYNDREIAPFQLYVMARYLSALYALLAVVLTYAAARVAFNRRAGTVAAALVAFSPLMVEHAHYATPNAQTTMLMAAALLLALMILKQRRVPHLPLGAMYGLAGLLVGLTMAARYNAAVIGLITGLALVTAWWRDRRQWAAVLAGFALMPVGFALGTPGIVLVTDDVIRQIRGILEWYRERGGGPGFTAARGPHAVGYHWRYLLLAGIGVPAAGLSAWGLWRGLRAGRGSRWQDAWIAGVMLLYMTVYTGLALLGSRLQANLLFPLILPLALLAGYGASQLDTGTPRRRWIVAIWVAAALLWLVVPALLFVYRITIADNRLDAQAWIYEHVPRGTAVYLLGPYNVPLDPLDYNIEQTYAREAGAKRVRNTDAPLIVYSDAYPYITLRDRSLSNAKAIAREEDIRALLASEWVEVAHFERMPWIWESVAPDDVSYWFQIGITIYCRLDNCPVAAASAPD